MKSLFKTVSVLMCLCATLLMQPQVGATQGTTIESQDAITSDWARSLPTMMVLKPQVKVVFPNQDEITNEMYDLLHFDLSFSGAFRVFRETPQAAYINRQDIENNHVRFSDWHGLEVNGDTIDYVVKTFFVPHGRDQYEFQVLVYDIPQKERPIGDAYGKPPQKTLVKKILRSVGHRATARIITALTDGRIKPITQSRIAFINHNPAKQTKELYLIDYDGWKGSLERLTRFESITQFPDWSPDGRKLAYVSYMKNWPDAFVHDLASGEVRALARYKGINTTPRWFPDSQRLAISLSVKDKNPEIYVVKDGGKQDPKRLTYNKLIDQSPDVSPTGTQIVYQSESSPNYPQIYIMDVDGGNKRRLTYFSSSDRRKCDTPFWSPIPLLIPNASKDEKGYRIAFAGYTDSLSSDIFVMNPDGSGRQMITDGKSNNLNPSWSPAGQYVAFSSTRLGKAEIFITPSDPGKLLPNGKRFYRVTTMSGNNLNPAWSPN